MITTIYVSCSVFADLLGKGRVCLGFGFWLSLSRRRNIREGLPRAYASFMFCGEGKGETAISLKHLAALTTARCDMLCFVFHRPLSVSHIFILSQLMYASWSASYSLMARHSRSSTIGERLRCPARKFRAEP